MTGARSVPITLAIIACLLVPGATRAQSDRYSPIVLQVPAGVRQAGLAGVLTAVRDVDNIFSNPALVGTVAGTSASIAHFGESNQGALSTSASLGTFSVGIGAQYLRMDVPLYFDDRFVVALGPPIGSETLTQGGRGFVSGAGSSLAASFALATVLKGLRLGAAFKYVEEQIGTWRDGSPAVDVGVARDGNITLGLAVQNIGRDITYMANQAVHLPLRTTLGASTGRQVGPLDLGLTAGVSVLRDGFVSPAGAVEWGYSPLEGYNYVVRLGLRRPELREQQPVTLGASFSLDRFTVDYAFEDMRHGSGHRIGLRVR